MNWYKAKAIRTGPCWFPLLLLLIFILSGCSQSDTSSQSEPKNPPQAQSTTLNNSRTNEAATGEIPSTSTENAKSKDARIDNETASEIDSQIDALELTILSKAFGRFRTILAGEYACIYNGIVRGVHRPPYDIVYFVNPDSKTYLTWDADNESYPFDRLIGKITLNLDGMKRVGNKNLSIPGRSGKGIFNIKCDVYETYDDEGKPILRCMSTSELNVPRSVNSANQFNVGWPRNHGYIVKVESLDRKSAEKRWNTLYEIEKAESSKVSRNLFEVPDNFKKVEDVATFAFAGSDDFSKGDLEDLFEYHFDDK